MKSFTEDWNTHRVAVDKLAEELGGVAFTKAPFDIVDKEKRFYEVKTVRPRTGRHSSECSVHISENEIKFGEIFEEGLTYIILFKGNKYTIPFKDLKRKIEKAKPYKSNLFGTWRTYVLLCLSKKFLNEYNLLRREGC